MKFFMPMNQATRWAETCSQMTKLIIKCSTEKSETKKRIIDRTTLMDIEGKFSFNQEN